MIIPEDTNRDGIALTGATDTLPEYIKGTPPSIETLRQNFDDARDDENDIKSQKDRDYFDGPGQLSSEVRTTLKARNQPAIYTNRVRPAVNGVLGVLEAGRRDPRGVPRNPDDEESADICTKTLRFINDESKFNDTQMDCAENFFIEGTCAVIVEMVDDKIVPTQIRWEEFYADRFSRRADFKDARYMGIAKWQDAAKINETYPTRIEEIGDPMRPQSMGMFGNDKFEDIGDCGGGWINTRRKRVLIVEEYRITDGEWKRCVYIAAGVLEYGPSPYKDEKGRPTNPIEAVSCYVDRNNGRYGMVRDMVPIQDEVNASRSRSLHLMNSRQLQYDPKSGGDPVDSETARIEAARADGVLPLGWSINATSDMTQANMVRNQEAKGEIERMGPTPAVLGRQEGAGQSGRARLVSQQAGLTELARPLGRLHGWVLRVYEQMWQRARQFWTGPMWIRVTDELKAASFLQINEPVMGMVMAPAMDPQTGQPAVDPMTGQPVMMPTQGVVEYKNRPAELSMDIILDDTQDTANLQEEIWGELMQLVSNAGGLQSIYSDEFETALEMSPIADKPRLVEKLKAKREARDQNMVTQLQQQVEQLTQALQQKQATDQAVTQSTVEKNQAQTLQAAAGAHKTATEADKGQAELYAALGIDPLLALQD
jgi:hypothetical protein